MSERYKLSPELHESIYTERIAARYLPKSKPQEQPCAIITGGQPGSGKSGLTAMAIERFRESGYVLVDADKMRPYHPEYTKLMRADDKIAANLTHADCGPWATRLMRDGVAGRRNLIIDQTSRDPAAMAAMTQRLRQAGYSVEFHAMAVSSEVSEQRILQRYEGQRARDGFGRYSTKDKHDEAYAGVANTVASVDAGGQVDRLCLFDRYLKLIYQNQLVEGQWQPSPNARQALDAERSRPMTLQERRDFAKGYDGLHDLLTRAERNASADELLGMAKLQSQARGMLMAEVFRQETPERAMQQHPELAAAYGGIAAIEAKAKAEGLDEGARAVVMARVHENVAASIERGRVPHVDVIELERARNGHLDPER